MSNLHKETEAARSLLLSCKEALGDDAEAIAATIEGETSLLEAMTEAVKRIAELEAHADAIAAHVIEVTARATRFAAQRERIRAALVDAMEVAGLKKLELPIATLSVRPGSASVKITSEADLPAAYFKEPAPVPDKKAIGEALKAGTVVPGATLSNAPPALQVRFK